MLKEALVNRYSEREIFSSCYEGVWRSIGIAAPVLNLGIHMEGPLHDTVALPTAMAPQEWKMNANWTPDPAWTICMQETSLTLPGIKRNFVSCSTNSRLAALTTPCQYLDIVKENKTSRNVGTEPSRGVKGRITGRRNNL
jgi:hypothetical protein